MAAVSGDPSNPKPRPDPEGINKFPDDDIGLGGPAGNVSAPKDQRGGVPAWAKIAAVFALLCGLVAFLLFQSEASEAFVYSKLVHEVVDAPESFRGKTLRMEGELEKGSVVRRDKPCEWRFTLKKNGKSMRVRFPECVVPDTFRDDMGISVTVQGRLESKNTFLADQVIPKCPSKYEMKQRQGQGEAMPHAYPAAREAG